MTHDESACAAEPANLDTRPVFIDALNVAYWCGSPPSLRMPLALMAGLMTQGRETVLYFDASAPYQLKDEANIYAQLSRHARYSIEVPSGRPADRVMLRHATASGGCVLSRDKYRDHRRRYRRLIDDPTRLLAGMVRDNRVLVPLLGLDVPLPASAADAWTQLEPLLTALNMATSSDR